MARTLVVTNRKGGSGKTTTALNLAAGLASRGQQVLLIDLDTQGHGGLGLGWSAAHGRATVHDLFERGAPLAAAVQSTPLAGLSLLPANPLFMHGDGGCNQLLLRQHLQQEGMQEAFDAIVIDTPPSLDILLLNALQAADRVLVPFVPHFLGTEGIRQLARTLFRVASSGSNANLRLLGFLPVMLDQRIGLHRRMLQDVAQQFGALKILPGIRNDIRVAESFAAGKPLSAFAPSCRAAQDYQRAVESVLAHW